MFIISYFIGIYEDKTKKCKFGTKDYVMNKIINKFSVLFFVMVVVFSGIFAAAMPQVAFASDLICYDDPERPQGYDPYEPGPSGQFANKYKDETGHEYGKCKDGTSGGVAEPKTKKSSGSCDGVKTNIIDCESSDGDGVENTGLWKLLLNLINILSAGIGLAAIGGAVYGAVLYSSAGANPDNVKKAKEMFVNIGIGVVAYLLMYSLLNYLIPGGLFN